MGDLQPKLRQLTKEGRWDQLGTLFDDAQISTLSVIGTAEEVGEELRNRFSGIADRLALSIPQGIQRSDLSALVEATRS